MTNEEAIEIIKQDIPCEHDTDLIEALDVAIKALEQQPCDDAISREDRLIDLANAIESDDSGYWTNKRISSVLRNIPSVTQKCEKCAMNGSGSKYCDNCKQKSGKWILADEQNKEDVENDNYRFICSECQCSDIHAKGAIVPYCWKCGAKMVEPQESEG